MFTVRIKGKRNPSNTDMVKLWIIFYKSGYPRVDKVLPVTGLFSDWSPKFQRFSENSPANRTKNRILQKTKLKYLVVAERRESENKNWSPVELSYHFDNREKYRSRYITVSSMIDKMEKKYMNQKRYNDGRIFTSNSTAEHYRYLKCSLENFTIIKYRREFSKYYFRDIDERFLIDFAIFEQKRGAKNGNNGGIKQKLKHLHATFVAAKKEGVYGIDLSIFESVKNLRRQPKRLPNAISYRDIQLLENIDHLELKKRECLNIDLFLFRYYAGGISGMDMFLLTKDNVRGNTIVYKRIKNGTEVRTFLIDKALDIIEKYKKDACMNYVFPVIKKKYADEKKLYSRVNGASDSICKTVQKVCRELGVRDDSTSSSARSGYISKMLDDGYHPLQVAEQTGNSPYTIYKYYYTITNPEEIRQKMNREFGDATTQP